MVWGQEVWCTKVKKELRAVAAKISLSGSGSFEGVGMVGPGD